MVLHRSQHRSDRMLLVSPPRAQSSLFPPLCSSSHGLRARVHGTGANTEREGTLGIDTLLLFLKTVKGQTVSANMSLRANWQEPSIAKNSSSSRARKLALNSGTTRRSSKNAENRPKPLHRHQPPEGCTVCTVGTRLCCELECLQTLAMN